MLHRILNSAVGFFVVVGLLLTSSVSGANDDRSVVSAREAREAARAGDMTIIDVRSPMEWRMTGIPEGSLPVTVHNPGGREAFLREILEAVDGDRTRAIALICAGGARSGAAQALLQANGFTAVHNLHEGMQGSRHGRGWLAEGLPVEPCASC
jgi:rhodanese-related sulfurtransferase